MKENVDICIKYMNCTLQFITNDINLYEDIKEEYEKYFEFSENISEAKVKIKVLNDSELYMKYFDKIRKNKNKRSYIFYEIRRNNVIIIDSRKKEVYVIYNEYTDERLQHVEEIMIAIFGKEIEDRGYYFIHASCVSKINKGIAILGNNNTGKTSLMLKLVQNNYDFIANTQIGIRNHKEEFECIAIPTRPGIRIGTLKNNVVKEKYIKGIRRSRGFIERFGNEEIAKLEKYEMEKFNLKLNEFEQIFNVKLLKNTNIKLFIEPHFISKFNNIDIVKIENCEIMETLRSNRRNGIYQSVPYIEHLYNDYKANEKTDIIYNNKMKFYKLYYGEKAENEILKTISKMI